MREEWKGFRIKGGKGGLSGENGGLREGRVEKEGRVERIES